MSERPQISIRMKQEERILRDANARKEERAATTLAILQEQADKANENRANEEGHKKIERRIWLKQIAAAKMQIKTAKQLNCVTLIAAIFALSGVVAVVWSISDARQATISANRAWLDASYLILLKSLEDGDPIAVQLAVVNSGREPATDVVWKFKLEKIPYIALPVLKQVSMSENSSCSEIAPERGVGAVLYPSVPNHNFFIPYTFPIQNSIDIRGFAKPALSRNVSLVIEGCVAYHTFEKAHFSAFRFFLRDVPGPSCTIVPATTNPQPSDAVITQSGILQCWRFNLMESGNNAN